MKPFNCVASLLLELNRDLFFWLGFQFFTHTVSNLPNMYSNDIIWLLLFMNVLPENSSGDTDIILFCSCGRGPPRFEGDRPRFGDRDGYRGGPRGAPGDFGGEKGGAPAEFQPSFRVRALMTICMPICHC